MPLPPTDDKLMELVQAAIARQADILPEFYSRDEVARLIIASIMHAKASVLESHLVTNERDRHRFIAQHRRVANVLLNVERVPL